MHMGRIFEWCHQDPSCLSCALSTEDLNTMSANLQKARLVMGPRAIYIWCIFCCSDDAKAVVLLIPLLIAQLSLLPTLSHASLLRASCSLTITFM